MNSYQWMKGLRIGDYVFDLYGNKLRVKDIEDIRSYYVPSIFRHLPRPLDKIAENACLRLTKKINLKVLIDRVLTLEDGTNHSARNGVRPVWTKTVERPVDFLVTAATVVTGTKTHDKF